MFGIEITKRVNYFYSVRWKDKEGKYRSSYGVLENQKRIKNTEDSEIILMKVLSGIEIEYEVETGVSFCIKKYDVLTMNEI